MPFSLCNDGVKPETKEAIVAAMITAGRPQDIGYQKPEMKTVILDQPQVHLEDFVGEQSWLLFQLLAVNTDWMQTASIHWTQSDQYLRFVNIVKSLKVVNDCAERSIKDVTEFVNYARDRDVRSQAVMVVQHHRQLIDFANLTKLQIDNMDDFI